MKNLMKITLIVGFWLSFQLPARSQAEYELNEAIQKKMSTLSFLEGKWKGSGWMLGQDRQKKTFVQEETVEFKLSGTLLEVEGLGKSGETVVHNAIAWIHPGENDGEFQFTSFLQSGLHGTYPAKFENGKLIWNPVEQVRYTIWINEQGQWQEIGEYNAGSAWYQFFEMTLDRIP